MTLALTCLAVGVAALVGVLAGAAIMIAILNAIARPPRK